MYLYYVFITYMKHNNNLSLLWKQLKEKFNWYHKHILYTLLAWSLWYISYDKFVIDETYKDQIVQSLAQHKKDSISLEEKWKEVDSLKYNFYKDAFNRRLSEKGISLYWSVWEFIPYNQDMLNKNIISLFKNGLNDKASLVRRMYSSEYHNYVARQRMSWQSLIVNEKQKNDLYTLNHTYEQWWQRDLRIDIIALLWEANFKNLIIERYKSITFSELFAIARTIVTNIRQPINTYTWEERNLIISTLLDNRSIASKKNVISKNHALVSLVGKDKIFNYANSFVELYNNLVPENNKRNVKLFRDWDFSDFWWADTLVFKEVDTYINSINEKWLPFALLFVNHGWPHTQDWGMTALTQSSTWWTKKYISPSMITPLLWKVANKWNDISTIQYLHCYADNSAQELLKNIKNLWIDDYNLPVLIVQSDINETSLSSSQYKTAYSNNLQISRNSPLVLQHYFYAQSQPTWYNAFMYVPRSFKKLNWVDENEDFFVDKKYFKHY